MQNAITNCDGIFANSHAAAGICELLHPRSKSLPTMGQRKVVGLLIERNEGMMAWSMSLLSPLPLAASTSFETTHSRPFFDHDEEAAGTDMGARSPLAARVACMFAACCRVHLKRSRSVVGILSNTVVSRKTAAPPCGVHWPRCFVEALRSANLLHADVRLLRKQIADCMHQ
jgi:hypothetical protein